MTLRARLTAAFLVVVLGPVLLGAVFVGATTSTVARQRATDRLALAGGTVAADLDTLCLRLRTAAVTVATTVTAVADTTSSLPGTEPSAGPDGPAAAARDVVGRGLASAVRIEYADGTPGVSTVDPWPAPWADCAGYPDTAGTGPYQAIVARVELRDPAGATVGHSDAAQIVDQALLRQLAGAGGVAVTMVDGRGEAVLSTQDQTAAAGAARAVSTAVATGSPRATGGGSGAPGTGSRRDGRDSSVASEVVLTAPPHRQYVQQLASGPGQPLPLVLSVPYRDGQALYTVLLLIVAGTATCGIVIAWWLGRTTTRPLVELRAAVARVAEHDLSVRAPVRGHDEVSWLAATVNRMARETRAYLVALTASRDQLRDRLGVLGTTLSSTHDLPRILRVILHSAITATGAEAGAVLLVDEDQDVLVGRCGEGLIERGQPDPLRLRVMVGDGLLGTVAASGTPLRGVAGRDGPALARHEPRCHSYLAVPFSAPEPLSAPGRQRVRGVLVLYDRLGGDEFDDADATTLTAFASQAAIAVENVRVHEETRRQSLTDPLTGLRNYRFLAEQVSTEVERATRFNRPLCLLALDLDRFKEVNDAFGHAAGDAVLVEFARRIRGEIREVDAAFRQGGEEFVILLPDTDQAGGTIVAERLGAVVRSAPMVITSARLGTSHPVSQRVPVTVSIGVAVFPLHAQAAQQLLEAADTALYAAKAAGRDTYRVAATAGAQPVPAEPPAPRSAPRPTEPSGTGEAPGGAAVDDEPGQGPDVPPATAPAAPGERPATAPGGRSATAEGERPATAPASPGAVPGAVPGGASGRLHPPRQTRGR